MYIKASSPRVFGDNAKLEYSVSSSDVGKLSCLTFYYHMYGDDINTLNVFNGNARVFTKAGNQGKTWFKAKIAMNLQSQVTFEGIRETDFEGDIAIDEMTITAGICQDDCTENMNQSFGTLDIRYTSKFDPHCNWVKGITFTQRFPTSSLRTLFECSYHSRTQKSANIVQETAQGPQA
ncbi:hypothetical protein OS493_027031 [Desmophyllum pertusum]|uniref:MAM domain-containing protein n=1 Tax=Desmophyllum pertusum TaxID=174260 RepID=A0A9W9YKT0_9CNID|nr:hypothetical protein OS493_027031 [Desmophyllum pertusum]